MSDSISGSGAAPPVITHLSPLSVQASALIRSIDSLSTIFWFTIGGAFLSVFFAGLMLLETNVRSDSLYLGEFEVPKSILPLIAAGFALFMFWLTSNRLKMLHYVLSRSEFPNEIVRDLFRLNPPLFNVFSSDNYRRWSIGTGVGVLTLIWGIYFGNSVAIMLRGTLQASATSSQFDPASLWLFAGIMVATIAYGIYAISVPLKSIHEELHEELFKIGWPRYLYAFGVALTVFFFNNAADFNTADQDNDLLGPATANAIDGGTLFLNGIEVGLIGVRPLAADQICQDKQGSDYACGREARQYLQSLLQTTPVVCAPLYNIGRNRVAAACRLLHENLTAPDSFPDFFAETDTASLSQLVIARGYGLVSGIGGFGRDELAKHQEAAQSARLGIWQGSFDPQ